MAFNITDIKANLNKFDGTIRPSHFDVTITPPQSLSSKLTSDNNGISARDLVYLADMAELPGLSLQTTEIKHTGYGLVDKRPYRTGFIDSNIRFLEDSKANSITFFHKWMDSISGFSERTGDGKDQMLYPDEYQTTIEVTQYNIAGEKSIVCKLYKAYPITITPISLDWGTQNEVAKFTVTFGYESWNTDKIRN